MDIYAQVNHLEARIERLERHVDLLEQVLARQHERFDEIVRDNLAFITVARTAMDDLQRRHDELQPIVEALRRRLAPPPETLH